MEFLQYLLFLVHMTITVSTGQPATCFSSSDSDPFICMGNGVWCCNDSNSTCACKCKQGWKGISCSTLDLLPISRSNVGVPISSSMGANWGAGVVYEGGYWHAFVGAKTDITDGASDEFAQNHGIIHLRSESVGGDWENMGELKGVNGGNFGFRVDIKKHPNGGWLLMTEGYAAGDNRYPWDERFGFILLYSDSVYGPWSERVSYHLGRTMEDGSKNWQADPLNEDNNRWDCRMADPTFVIMENGGIYIGYRGTKCCCDEFIGAWGSAGEHEVETAGLLYAPSWEGPFERMGKIFEEGSDNEDMYMWRDMDGVHMLMHSQKNDHHNHRRRGSYAYSPDGQNWKLSHEEAWPTFLHYDDCGADSIVKRQRPSLVFDERGMPTHLVTGVSSSHHGLEWGDGWTVFQPVNNGIAQTSDCQGPCPVGTISDENGGCYQCSAHDIPDCLVVTSSPSRNQCTCTKCVNGKVGEFCDTPSTVASSTCPIEGWDLLPGSNDGRLFRCGEVINFAHFDESTSSWEGGVVGGWWGHCVPTGVLNNGKSNCGDSSDEGTDSATCQWPLVKKDEGMCKECEDHDVSDKCAPGQAISSTTQESCICQKCIDGWIGSQCSIEISIVTSAPSKAPDSPAPTLRSTPSPTLPLTPIPTKSPIPVPGSCGCGSADGMNQPECIGNTEQRCKQMINDEGKCKWTECNQPTAAPVNPPTPSPTLSSPTPSPIQSNNPTTKSPTSQPQIAYSCTENSISSFDLLNYMDELSYQVSSSPYTLSILAEGGAAGPGGSVVSEGQGYGLLTSAIALASLDVSDVKRSQVIEKFYGYFNGWKKMCINSSPSPCQQPQYCTYESGTAPCLPGWKHSGDLTTVIGTGAAPDGDVDAILGMIIALNALEKDSNLPDWYDELRRWTDQSCTQFLKDNTVLSSSGFHRILKLGSCWGGWNSEGNNPSYHGPGAYRVMRDFHVSYDGTRNYVMPDFGDSRSLGEKWNMLINSSYKFFETTQCTDTGLVPNWALVREVDSLSLAKQSGSFSGSGTPQYEFGAEASRTMWRVAIDSVLYPEESKLQAGDFLDPVHSKLNEGYNDNMSNWNENTLETCAYVNSVFSSWRSNGFIFGPLYSTLVVPSSSMTTVKQQKLVNAACQLVGGISSSESYYSKSWKVISMMTLNGSMEKVAKLLRQDQPTHTPTNSPTSSEGCYSNDYKHCFPNGYNRTSCSTIWLPNGSQGNCVALWGDCTSNSASCCGPAECFGSVTKSCVPPFTETSIPTTSPTIFQMTSPPSEGCSAKGEPCEINADCCMKKCKKKTGVCRK